MLYLDIKLFIHSFHRYRILLGALLIARNIGGKAGSSRNIYYRKEKLTGMI